MRRKRYLHIIYTTIRIWRHPSPGIIPVRRKKDAVYNPGEYSPTSLPKPRTVPLPGAIRQVSLQDWGLEDRHSLESGSQRTVCLIIRADLSNSDDKTAGVCQSVKGCGGGKPHINVRPLSHRHFCRVVQHPGEVVPQFPFSGIESLDIGTGKGEAPEGSNETLGIRKVLYMQ